MNARTAAAGTLAALSFALGLGAPARPAVAAQPASNVPEEARVRFQRGVQLFREGSFEAALAEFQKANQIAPSYRLLYNIAQVQFELHNYVEALRAFRHYLADGGAEIPAERRAKVTSDIRELERRVATLELVVNVDGASVLVDEVSAGLSPLPDPLLVNAGVRRVSVAKAGYVPVAQSVTIAGGERALLKLSLLAVAEPGPAAGPVVRQVAPARPADAARPENSHVATWVSLGVTGALAVGTAISALVTRDANADFDRELERLPGDRASIDDARARTKRLAALTDGLAAATLVATGLTIYFAASPGEDGEARKTARASHGPRPRISLLPTLGGFALDGRF